MMDQPKRRLSKSGKSLMKGASLKLQVGAQVSSAMRPPRPSPIMTAKPTKLDNVPAMKLEPLSARALELFQKCLEDSKSSRPDKKDEEGSRSTPSQTRRLSFKEEAGSEKVGQIREPHSAKIAPIQTVGLEKTVASLKEKAAARPHLVIHKAPQGEKSLIANEAKTPTPMKDRRYQGHISHTINDTYGFVVFKNKQHFFHFSELKGDVTPAKNTPVRFGLTGDPYQTHTQKLKAVQVEIIGNPPKQNNKKRRGGKKKGGGKGAGKGGGNSPGGRRNRGGNRHSEGERKPEPNAKFTYASPRASAQPTGGFEPSALSLGGSQALSPASTASASTPTPSSDRDREARVARDFLARLSTTSSGGWGDSSDSD